MKVLIVSSSPRKEGNSDVLCERFAKGASEAGHEVEKMMLRDKKISPCNACYACMETHICAIKDDMADIFPKLLKADVIVLALLSLHNRLSAPQNSSSRSVPLDGLLYAECRDHSMAVHTAAGAFSARLSFQDFTARLPQDGRFLVYATPTFCR